MMNAQKRIQEEILAHANKWNHYNNLLIEQCNSWLPEKEGLQNVEKRMRKKKNLTTFLLPVCCLLLLFATGCGGKKNNPDDYNAKFDVWCEIIDAINPEERAENFDYLVELTENFPNCEQKVMAYIKLGMIYKNDNPSAAFRFFEKADEMIPLFPEYSAVLKAYLNSALGFTCAAHDDFEQAQQYLIEAISVLEPLQEKDIKALQKISFDVHNALGMAYIPMIAIYEFYEQQEKADEYRLKTLLNAEKSYTPIDKAEGYMMYAYGVVENEPDKALEYIEKAYQIAIDENSSTHISTALDLFSNYEQAKGNIAGAINYLEKSLDFLKDKQQDSDIVNVYCNLKYLYGLFDDDKKVIEICLKGLKVADSINYKNYRADFHETLGRRYARLGKYKEAHFHTNAYLELREEMVNEESVGQINYQTARFDAERREMKINEMAEKQSFLKILMITGLTVSVVILTLLGLLLRLRTRQRRVLAETNAVKDKFFSIISHDLKNPAIMQKEALQLVLDNVSVWDTETLAQTLREILKSAEGEVELLYNLLNWAQMQSGRMPYTPTAFNLASALRPEMTLIAEMAKNKEITLVTEIPAEATLTADKNMLTTIIRNLLTNAVKFTPTGGTVKLEISAGTGVARNAPTRFTISDTGFGMTEEQIRNLFGRDAARRDVRPYVSTKGTANETGTGLGLIVCKELLEKHNSTLHIESVEGKGSTIWFEI